MKKYMYCALFSVFFLGISIPTGHLYAKNGTESSNGDRKFDSSKAGKIFATIVAAAGIGYLLGVVNFYCDSRSFREGNSDIFSYLMGWGLFAMGRHCLTRLAVDKIWDEESYKYTADALTVAQLANWAAYTILIAQLQLII
jgi:hypothetical protein